MTALWTSAAAVAATGGQVRGDWVALGVSIDTRSLRPGDLFVALTDRRDGHDFVAKALAAGAAAALVSRVPEDVAEDAPLLIVPDVLAALEALGRAGRARSQAKVVGVTGSVGKTSTKEMLVAALEGQGRVHAAEKSFNNHWGVPLTLARLPEDADFAVIEIGMNHPGEIAPLSRLARPHVGLITTVAAAHLEAFDGLEAIAREKGALAEGLEPGGTMVLNADIATFPILRAMAGGAHVLRFGEDVEADVRALSVTLSAQATVVKADVARAPLVFKIGAAGRHFAMNALGVMAVVQALGADCALAALGLAGWAPPAGRGTRGWVQLDGVEPGAGIELIDDAFNANPASMAAALAVLAAAEPVHDVGRIARGRRIAVLGDMLELGPREAALHAALADDPAMQTITRVHCVGPRMAALWEALPPERRGERADDAEALAARAHALVDPGDVVLVKGSKGSRVSLVVDALRRLGQAGAEQERGTG
ncbi:UDP-N-acetylmuramoyl-tripeptide--D-alanyl-D-alanine ligase [Maritimibacter sp. 55A14]|uniref:UDP-N-acetylmuramoyl-tripeptide--D-alanyl-D- alanine ligase n=1 Tax=Maritimibacter sp. 55A14 TaxID=2174844 RepID=UPI000D61F175|nr:UDP-N-acetylmuramoyl-tripeptide--D-alanyl-D-alanine ligase [Maritimibacter sp. 55A14]PWE34064.1 UDP-N-acetylmuramoyl-tripeptide--D-alanyl-D-alanine ligase [Maritimibacter sp. 55A14]